MPLSHPLYCTKKNNSTPFSVFFNTVRSTCSTCSSLHLTLYLSESLSHPSQRFTAPCSALSFPFKTVPHLISALLYLPHFRTLSHFSALIYPLHVPSRPSISSCFDLPPSKHLHTLMPFPPDRWCVGVAGSGLEGD